MAHILKGTSLDPYEVDDEAPKDFQLESEVLAILQICSLLPTVPCIHQCHYLLTLFLVQEFSLLVLQPPCSKDHVLLL
jgi:hypothetical protein